MELSLHSGQERTFGVWCTISREYVRIFQFCNIIQTDAKTNIVYNLFKEKNIKKAINWLPG